MTAYQSAVDYIKTSGLKTISRHGLFHAVREATGKILGGSRKELERIAQAVGGTYRIKNGRGYINL